MSSTPASVQTPYLRRVLVAVDFSDCSRSALEYAAALAESFGASLDVLHVWEQPEYLGAGLGELVVATPEGRSMLAQVTHKRAREELDKLVSQLPRHPGVTVRSRLEIGDPCEHILKAAAGGRHDLIVMGTHRRSGLRRLVTGSVAEKVLRRAACPVLTIRPTDFASAEAPLRSVG